MSSPQLEKSLVDGRLHPAYIAHLNLFFRVVNYRYQKGSIALTTNKGITAWPELLAGDEVLAGAILDRLLHSATVLNIQGRSYRLKDMETSLGGPASPAKPPQ